MAGYGSKQLSKKAQHEDGGWWLLLQCHAVLLHQLHLALLAPHQFLGSSVCHPKIHNQLTIGYDRCIVVVDGSHLVAVETGGDCSLMMSVILAAHNVLNMSNILVMRGWIAPCVIQALYSQPYMLTNVDDVDIIHLVGGAAFKGCTSDQVEDESIEAFGGVPVGSHALWLAS